MSDYKFITCRSSIAYLFPGQGSQSVGMGRELADAYAVAREAFEEADDTLGFALSELCFNGPEDALTDTINAQPALMAVSVAAMRALDSELGTSANDVTTASGPIYAAGHSMGEYTALVATGAISYADGLRLVRERGRLMKEVGEQTPGMMAAILGLDDEQVSAVCAECRSKGGVVQIANDNCPGPVVISGDKVGMECAMVGLQEAGARKVVPLAISIASHSPLMQPATAGLSAAIAETDIDAPCIPVIGNTNAAPMTDVDAIREELTAQLTGSVRWTESLRLALAEGVADFVEIGAGKVLSGLVRRTDRKAGRHSVNDPDSVKAFAEWLTEMNEQA
jgi:[acyl-carrier-protein] S-malonyltransferase